MKNYLLEYAVSYTYTGIVAADSASVHTPIHLQAAPQFAATSNHVQRHDAILLAMQSYDYKALIMFTHRSAHRLLPTEHWWTDLFDMHNQTIYNRFCPFQLHISENHTAP